MSDYISREAAIDALDALCDRDCVYSKKQRAAMCGACALGGAFDVVEELPAADVQEVKTGRWICGKCDVCGFMPPLNLEYDTVYDARNGFAWNFCPNCGARMEGTE